MYYLMCEQATKKGGIVCIFDVCSDFLFSAPDMGTFVLKYWHFKKLFPYWTYNTLDNGDNEDQADPY